MLLNSTFPADALERLRAQRLVALTQARAQPGAIAGRVFPKVLYGPAHPYGRVATEESIKAMTRDDVVAFHTQYSSRGARSITVVGDVTAAGVEAGDRKGTGRVAESGRHGRLYLSGRAGAGRRRRSSSSIGPVPRSRPLRSASPDRRADTPDYYAMQVMNTMLGGMFQSRLNANIREEKGYSYGVSSSFALWQRSRPLPYRRRHRRRQDRRRARRVHEGAAWHPRRAAGDRRGTGRRRKTR